MPNTAKASGRAGQPTIPTWTRGDRLRKSREASGLGVQDMADKLSVSRNTISNYEGDRVQAPYSALLAYELITGVPAEWIDTGHLPFEPDPPRRTRRPSRKQAPRTARTQREQHSGWMECFAFQAA